MKLLLSGEMSIMQINKSFQKHFPYLKLEFYSSDPVPGQISFWSDRLDENTRLNKVVKNMISIAIEFEPSNTIIELEQKFRSAAGLFVKVCRNINGVWHEIPQSVPVELSRQNALGNQLLKYSYNKHTLFL